MCAFRAVDGEKIRRVNRNPIDGCLDWTVGELVRLIESLRLNRANGDADE